MQNILETVFVNAVDRLIRTNVGRPVGNLYIQLDVTSGEIQVYDDREALLEKNIIFDWADHPEKAAMRSYKPQVNSIRAVLAGLKSGKLFDSPVFMRPLSISLVDDDFCEIEKIFTIGAEDLVPEGRLMKNLEQDLQNFSRKLFADIE